MNSKELLGHLLFSAKRECCTCVILSPDEATSIFDELGEQEEHIVRLREELATSKLELEAQLLECMDTNERLMDDNEQLIYTNVGLRKRIKHLAEKNQYQNPTTGTPVPKLGDMCCCGGCE